MIGFSKINEIITKVMDTGLVSSFYHSVDLVENKKGGWQPQALVLDEWEYVGPDDQKGFFGYIRNIGGVETLALLKDGSCGKGYTVQVPHRIVFFNNYEERNQDDLISALMTFIFIGHVDFKKILFNKRQILSQEAPGSNFVFREGTFYFAIDFNIRLNLTDSNCGQEIKCISTKNPFC